MKKQVARIKTDSLPPEAPKSVEGSILFELYEGFASPAQVEGMRQKFAAGISWGAVKEELFQAMDEHVRGYREEYKKLMADRSYMENLLKKGAAKAREYSVPFLASLRKAIGIDG